MLLGYGEVLYCVLYKTWKGTFRPGPPYVGIRLSSQDPNRCFGMCLSRSDHSGGHGTATSR